MRYVLATGLLLLSGLLVASSAQPPRGGREREPIPDRYGVVAKPELYPQTTAKRALLSVVEAIDRGEYAYLVAHLLDPGFVDSRVADRAKLFEAEVERELARLRDLQAADRNRLRPEDRLPVDPSGFQTLVEKQSRQRAFQQLVRDVELKLRNDPLAVKDLRKLARDGTYIDTEGGAKAVHEQVKDRAVFFRKVGDRWFVENRQEEEPDPPAGKEKEAGG